MGSLPAGYNDRHNIRISIALPQWQTMCTASGYAQPFILYEGGLECIAPLTSRLTTLGISTGYAAEIVNLIVAYKSDSRCRQLIIDLYAAFMAAGANSLMPGYFEFGSIVADQWNVFPPSPSDFYSVPYKSFDAIEAWNALRH